MVSNFDVILTIVTVKYDIAEIKTRTVTHQRVHERTHLVNLPLGRFGEI